MNQAAQIKTITITPEAKPNSDLSRADRQSRMTGQQLREKLEGYLPVADFDQLPFNTHLRYFIRNQDGKWVFRIGGFLKRNDLDNVMIGSSPLYGRGRVWKVNKGKAKFYYKPKVGRSVKSTNLPSEMVTKVPVQAGKQPIQSGGMTQPVQSGKMVVNLEKSSPNRSQSIHLAQHSEQLVQEAKAVKEVNRQYRMALEQQQHQIQELRKQLNQLR